MSPTWAAALAAAALLPAGCDNSPYPQSDEGRNVLYHSFYEEPKHLDPAQSYSAGESQLMGKVLEPPFEYHLLKRPYALEPLTAREVPEPQRRRVTFGGRSVDAVVYTVRLRPGIRYQDHPCFVASNRRLAEQDLEGVHTVWDITPAASRELVAADYVYAVRRLADPRLACPIFATLAKNLLGMKEYQDELQRRLEAARRARREAAGPLYNQQRDERYNPVPLDYGAAAGPFPFVREVDRYTFEAVLAGPYPQILYWMAMTFFAPVPPEAIAFFDQPGLRRRSILFDKNVVGTGPFVLREFDPTNQIVFVRNRNFREERYPDLPRPDGDDREALANYTALEAAGMLDDVGRRLPMIDRVVYRMERESIPRWNKFLQGYYDSSGISSDLFDQAVTLTSKGDSALTDELAGRGIRLLTSQPITVSYYAFNMNDSVVGGTTEAGRKLRQAISIAFDIEEEIAIFANGRGIPAHSPLPPGIFGHEKGRAGINPVVYRWDDARGGPVRRSLAEARALLAEAGYPNGYGPDGRRLTVRFATTANSPDSRAWARFIRKQFEKLNIHLVAEVSDYNRFRDKVLSGNFQFLRWGWLADYPDPENFLFLLYGPNGKTVSGGENVPNYRDPRYDALFRRMESMENSPQRLAIIREMIGILRRDAPWIFGYHPLAFGLYHRWYRNAYPHALALNLTKYQRIDVPVRTAYRRQHNAARWWPLLVLAGVLAVTAIPAVRSAARRLRET